MTDQTWTESEARLLVTVARAANHATLLNVIDESIQRAREARIRRQEEEQERRELEELRERREEIERKERLDAERIARQRREDTEDREDRAAAARRQEAAQRLRDDIEEAEARRHGHHIAIA